jgi:hypothetical protein
VAPLPPFDAVGLLPPARHTCTEDEVRVHLVDAFPTSTRRPAIFARWRLLRLGLLHILGEVEQWLDGSFVENKDEPDDMDVVSVFDGPSHDALPEGAQAVVKSMTLQKNSKPVWACDSYPVPVYPPGHPLHDASMFGLAYWHDWWGHTRPTDPRGHLPKGYVVVDSP